MDEKDAALRPTVVEDAEDEDVVQEEYEDVPHDETVCSDGSMVKDFQEENIAQNISPSTSDTVNNTYVRSSGENVSSSVRHRHVTETKGCQDYDQPISTRRERGNRPLDRQEVMKSLAAMEQAISNVANQVQELGELRRSIDTIIYLLVFIVVLLLVLFLTQTAVHYTNKEVLKSLTAVKQAINDVSGVGLCPDGWIRSGSSKCFGMFCELLTWAAAQTYCIEMGGTLASFQNNREMMCLFKSQNHCYVEYQTNDYWIGGFKEDEVWMWKGESADTNMKFTAWGLGQPRNSTDLGCAKYFPLDQSWYTHSCSDANHFICEKSV